MAGGRVDNLKHEIAEVLVERYGMTVSDALAAFDVVEVEFEGLAWEAIPAAFAALLKCLEDCRRGL